MSKPVFAKVAAKKTLADIVADDIRGRIVSGELQGGTALPTESELAKQFGVSRIAVRDACRVLMAQGLVDIKHGMGMFVTQPQNAAFENALLLALQRADASVWDVEQFEQAVFPEVVALASTQATKKEQKAIKTAIEKHLAFAKKIQTEWWDARPPDHVLDDFLNSHLSVMTLVFAATHNAVFAQLAVPLTRLRSAREIVPSKKMTFDELFAIEEKFYNTIYKAIASGKPDSARRQIKKLMQLPDKMVKAMKKTPIGDVSSTKL